MSQLYTRRPEELKTKTAEVFGKLSTQTVEANWTYKGSSNYLICKIEKIEHLDSLFLRLKSLPKKEIIIETEHDLLDLISNHLNSVGLPFQWFLFGKMTIFINL